MSQPVVIEETPKSAPIKDIISLIALILGTMLISVGAFLALGMAWGLVILGVMFVVVAILFGFNR